MKRAPFATNLEGGNLRGAGLIDLAGLRVNVLAEANLDILDGVRQEFDVVKRRAPVRPQVEVEELSAVVRTSALDVGQNDLRATDFGDILGELDVLDAVGLEEFTTSIVVVVVGVLGESNVFHRCKFYVPRYNPNDGRGYAPAV